MAKNFQLSNMFVEFTHMNTRLEKAGPNELVSAVDLTMSIQMENDVLDSILPGLRATFYGKPPKGEAGDLADQGKADQLIRLKYPALSEQSLDTEWVNYELRFHYGLDENADIVLDDCTVKSMKLELHDGGTVDLSWKVAAHPSDDQYADLQERLRARKVEISLAKSRPVQRQADLLNNEPEQNPVAAALNDSPLGLPADKVADATASLG